ncbi:mechanosensitive ion channel family protein [Algoriphagus chordae]|uniref:Mechanosensitive ion channel-like protein n=1 Tax=Algoriphagus chordae TaxID=237019 RepID=A0A2W7QSX7_9BACT|nr:mechanosensitive ion channel family protein [Algoriphagus chordae]PZX51354.1 mechanosensitive ion channel-like protein [Algoriphagus chordae]
MIFKFLPISKQNFNLILIICCFFTFSSNLSAQQKTVKLDTIPSDSIPIIGVKKYPVVFFTDTLFYISSKLGPFSAAERASNQSNKLALLIENDALDTAILTLYEDNLSVEIIHGEQIISSITQNDAEALGKDKAQLAKEYIAAIKSSYTRHYGEKNLIKNLTRTGILLGIFIVLYFLVKFINKGFNKLIDFILRKWHRYFKGVKIKNFEILSAAREEKLFFLIMRVLKIFMIILLLYLSLPIIFSIFPATKGLATTLLDYITSPVKSIVLGFIGYLDELFMIMVVVVITYYFVKAINIVSKEVESGNLSIPGFYPEWAKPTFNLFKIIIIAFSFIVIFPYLPGSDSPAFQGVSVFLGLLISLGSSSAISNIIAGLVIIYMRAFKLGDRVKIGDTVGDVIEKTMLVTRLRTIKNEEVTIPNAAILAGKTINYSAEANGPGLILHSTVTIGYDVPWREVHKLLIGAALKTDRILKEPVPFVLQTSLDDFYVSYQINAYTNAPEKAAVIYSDLHSFIQDAFTEAEVEIMSPHYRAERDGNQLTIPPSYLPEDKIVPSDKGASKAEKPKE